MLEMKKNLQWNKTKILGSSFRFQMIFITFFKDEIKGVFKIFSVRDKSADITPKVKFKLLTFPWISLQGIKTSNKFKSQNNPNK